MSRARTFADLATASEADNLGRRNIVDNGNFAVHQRTGTITVAANTGTDTLDRWEVDTANCDEISIEVTQADDIPPELGEGYSCKLQIKTVESAVASNEIVRLLHFPEAMDCQRLGYGTANTKTTTLSFWVKSSIAGTFAVNIYADDGADIIGSTYTISTADTWEKKSLTFAGNTLGVIANDNGHGVYLQWIVVAGSDFTATDNTSWSAYATGKLAYGHVTNTHATTDESTWQIAGVQWELGEVATPFEHISYAENLAKCQRYFYTQASGDNDPLGSGVAEAAASSSWIVHFPVPMRTEPTLVVEEGTDYYQTFGGGASDNFNGMLLADVSEFSAYVYNNSAKGAGGNTAGRGIIAVTNNASAKVSFRAEL